MLIFFKFFKSHIKDSLLLQVLKYRNNLLSFFPIFELVEIYWSVQNKFTNRGGGKVQVDNQNKFVESPKAKVLSGRLKN